MNRGTWFQDLLDGYEDDLEYRIEQAKLDITESICEAMEEAGISRKQLAEKMNTSAAAITKFLNGKANFTLKTLVKFSICLEKDLIVKLRSKPKKQLDPYKLFSRSYINLPVQSTDITNMKLSESPYEEWSVLTSVYSQNKFQIEKRVEKEPY